MWLELRDQAEPPFPQQDPPLPFRIDPFRRSHPALLAARALHPGTAWTCSRREDTYLGEDWQAYRSTIRPEVHWPPSLRQQPSYHYFPQQVLFQLGLYSELEVALEQANLGVSSLPAGSFYTLLASQPYVLRSSLRRHLEEVAQAANPVALRRYLLRLDGYAQASLDGLSGLAPAGLGVSTSGESLSLSVSSAVVSATRRLLAWQNPVVMMHTYLQRVLAEADSVGDLAKVLQVPRVVAAKAVRDTKKLQTAIKE